MRSGGQSKKLLHAMNEYIGMDTNSFKERVQENRDRLRSKLRELSQAKKIYMDLLHFNNNC